jgi:hypothetical protein
MVGTCLKTPIHPRIDGTSSTPAPERLFRGYGLSEEIIMLSGSGRDVRAKARLTVGNAYWLVVSRHTDQLLLGGSWEECPASKTFPTYAIANDGGNMWKPGTRKAALRTTIWCTDE